MLFECHFNDQGTNENWELQSIGIGAMAEYRTIVDAIKEEVEHELPVPRSL